MHWDSFTQDNKAQWEGMGDVGSARYEYKGSISFTDYAAGT